MSHENIESPAIAASAGPTCWAADCFGCGFSTCRCERECFVCHQSLFLNEGCDWPEDIRDIMCDTCSAKVLRERREMLDQVRRIDIATKLSDVPFWLPKYLRRDIQRSIGE